MKITSSQLRQLIREEITKLISEAKSWTAEVRWSKTGETELIDVDASSKEEAIKLVTATLASDYEPGGKIVQISPTTGGFSISRY